MATINKFDLLSFIYNIQINRRPRGLRFKELMEICNCDPQGKKDQSRPAKCSYRTLIKYLRELMAGNWLKKKIDPKSGRPLYYIPRGRYKDVDDLITKGDIHDLIDSLDARWLNPLRNLINRILEEEKDPYRVFNEYCFAFIGEMPFAFTKAPGALDDHIAFENRLRNRYHQDIEKFREDFLGTGEVTSERLRECLSAWREEIGGTIEEYYRKLTKKAEKLPFPQRMWTAQAYSEEEIEKMLDDIKKQRMYKEKG